MTLSLRPTLTQIRLKPTDTPCPDNSPEAEARRWRARATPGDRLRVDFELLESWREPPAVVSLTALFEAVEEAGEKAKEEAGADAGAEAEDAATRCLVAPAAALEGVELAAAEGGLAGLAARLNSPCVTLGEPLGLSPVHIAKPWGQEIWYTGIERRGVAGVRAQGMQVPLPWLLAALPLSFPRAQPPLLLKILDPLPEPVFGDLYFELHREKREVYVVTAVDPVAWPQGRGAIRMGFDPELLRDYDDEARFRADFLRAVRDYEQVRRDIDARLEPLRAAAGYASDDPVPAAQLRAWLAAQPEALRAREQTLRQAMERFTRLQPLAVGDVVRVPCLQPHALQHGVRTVEFQTPVYERLILSFAQKVLTQAHWDTEEAARLMHLGEVPLPALDTLASGPDWSDQRIVDFEDFEVRRIRPGSASLPLESGADYAVAMAVGGALRLGELRLAAEDALIVPAGASLRLSAEEAGGAALLWARPRS